MRTTRRSPCARKGTTWLSGRSLSEEASVKMQKIVDQGGYQYGDKVTICTSPHSKAVKVKGNLRSPFDSRAAACVACCGCGRFYPRSCGIKALIRKYSGNRSGQPAFRQGRACAARRLFLFGHVAARCLADRLQEDHYSRCAALSAG